MTEFSERLFVPERFMQQVGEIGPAIRPSVELEGTEWLASFDRVVAGSSGIVPYVASRTAFVKAELEKGEQTEVERVRYLAVPSRSATGRHSINTSRS